MRRSLLIIFFAACGTMDPIDEDAGLSIEDAGIDASIPAHDAGLEDAGTPIVDAGTPFIDAGTPPSLCTANGIPGTCIDVGECINTRRPTVGLCPGASNIQCCTPRSANACNPNDTPQPNTGLTQLAAGPNCTRPGMIRVTTFCIDQYEGSLLEILDGGVAVPFSPFINPGTKRIRAQSTPNAVPQGYMTQLQAAAACSGAGKRLCTDAEWLRACKGASTTTYPYGSTRQSGVCNDARSVHPAIELYGTSASWIYSHIDSPCLNQLDGGLARTGEHPGCVTTEGAFDMMGNLHEWTADPNGTFRGGFYVDTRLNGNGCDYVTTAHDVGHWDYSTGFRCCSDD